MTNHVACLWVFVLLYVSCKGQNNLPSYQSHPVTLACVDRDSYQSRLGLTY